MQVPGMLVPMLNATSHVSLPEQEAPHANKVMPQAVGLVAQRPAARKVQWGTPVTRSCAVTTEQAARNVTAAGVLVPNPLTAGPA